MAPFTLAHLSDPHLPPLPKPRLIELAGKRALGYVNWTRNRHKYQRREVLDTLVADIKAQAPDHIAVTGDLVNLALEAEFAPARAWLDGVGPPDRVTTIPGNHDAYVRATSHRFGETMEQAMRRELKEEGDIDLTGEALLHGIFLNSHISRRDHVAVYVVRHFRQDRLPAPNHEIIECGFFDSAALPEGATPGTRLRIAEVLEGKPLIATWR